MKLDRALHARSKRSVSCGQTQFKSAERSRLQRLHHVALNQSRTSPALLRDVRQLMRQQTLARPRFGVVLVLIEVDVVAGCESVGGKRMREPARSRIRVDAHCAEIGAELLLHRFARRLRNWRSTSIRLVEALAQRLPRERRLNDGAGRAGLMNRVGKRRRVLRLDRGRDPVCLVLVSRARGIQLQPGTRGRALQEDRHAGPRAILGFAGMLYCARWSCDTPAAWSG